jgi:hypothetical protein
MGAVLQDGPHPTLPLPDRAVGLFASQWRRRRTTTHAPLVVGPHTADPDQVRLVVRAA